MVRLSCGVQFTRTLLFILNILFLLFGLAITSLGIYIKVNGNFDAITAAHNITQALGGDTMQWIAIVMIVVGLFTACLATFGCLGAHFKNRGFLYSYALSLTLIVLIEFAAVIVILRFRNDLWKSYDSGFADIFNQAYEHDQTETIKVIEKLEREFQCCGVDSSKDYEKISKPIPPSCYPGQDPERHPYPYSFGCAETVAIWVWAKLPVFAAVLGVILFIEIFGILSSLVLGVAISHSSDVLVYHQF